ncbi:MAG: ATP-binding cassette domain-containing protein [Clostridia bacterium]|nr:ATP-binding cassette domain-containing protein [Clostridia bacterium]
MALQAEIHKKLGRFSLDMAFEAEDETLALLGASGCGKSMTLRCIAGVEKPDSGRIVLDGAVLYDSARGIDLKPQQRRVGLMFQHYALFPNMTVLQNVMCGTRRGGRGRVQKDKAMRALDSMGIADLAARLPRQLSGGQQQRTALARMLVSDPAVLLLDEPFSALDSHLRFRMEEEMRKVIRQFGKTVLLVSHDRDEVYRLADRVAIVKDGRVDRLDTRAAVFADPGSRTACALTGCKNISSIRPLDGERVFAVDWGVPLKLSPGPGVDALGLRMHAICPGEGENTFRCRVCDVIENPFSFTVMLRPLEAPDDSVPIGWETEKDLWRGMMAEEVTVHFPDSALLRLKG